MDGCTARSVLQGSCVGLVAASPGRGLAPTPSLLRRAPMILNVRLVLRRRAQAELHGDEALFFIEDARRCVLLMRVQLDAVGAEMHGMAEQRQADAATLATG